MNTPLISMALCACLLSLVACDKTPKSPPTPTVTETVPTVTGAVPTGSTATVGSAFDPSMPTTSPAYPSTGASGANAAPKRTDGTRNNAQESSATIGATPVPGQNNDHSAPLGPAKPASTP